MAINPEMNWLDYINTSDLQRSVDVGLNGGVFDVPGNEAEVAYEATSASQLGTQLIRFVGNILNSVVIRYTNHEDSN